MTNVPDVASYAIDLILAAKISLAEYADFYFCVCIFLIDVDRQVAELLDQFFKVLRLDLGQVNRDAFLVYRQVCLLQSRRRNQVRQFHSGAKRLQITK